jgi:hypothetical protein
MKNSGKKQTRKGNRPRRNLTQPPQLASNVQVVHTYRFRSTVGTMVSIGQTNLRGIAGAVCCTANSDVRILAGAVKIHKISIWSPPASQGAVSTCSVIWSSAIDYLPMVELTDTTMSTAIPAHVSAVPPKGCAASFWLGAGTNNIVSIVAPVGSIIDVHCTHVLQDDGASGSIYTVAAGTLGALYYLPLDGSTDGFLPVSLTTTT